LHTWNLLTKGEKMGDVYIFLTAENEIGIGGEWKSLKNVG
jgi:hypothetical protein